MTAPPIITLTTDFGLIDPYVGIMKGVILGIQPHVHIVDITHDIPAGSVETAAISLKEACPFFPRGTIHVAVVDPGVGGVRRPILVQTPSAFFIGPDNGLFWPIMDSEKKTTVIHLTQKHYFLPHVSTTFHGRDIFAPTAAHLSLGVPPEDMGEPVTDPVKLTLSKPRQTANTLSGQIRRVDRFGNLITNIHKKDLERFTEIGQVKIKIGNILIGKLKSAYADVMTGNPLALIGSTGYLEIAVNQGRADTLLEGDEIDLKGMSVEITRVPRS